MREEVWIIIDKDGDNHLLKVIKNIMRKQSMLIEVASKFFHVSNILQESEVKALRKGKLDQRVMNRPPHTDQLNEGCVIFPFHERKGKPGQGKFIDQVKVKRVFKPVGKKDVADKIIMLDDGSYLYPNKIREIYEEAR